MPYTGNPVIDVAMPHPRAGEPLGIATLGPAGTSSEAAAGFLRRYLAISWADHPDQAPEVPITLHERYEAAAQSVLDRASSLLVVANAYHGISAFYMEPRLAFAGAYCFDTPHYGIATRSGKLPRGPVTVASHPAPIPLIAQLLQDRDVAVRDIVHSSSTSAAAAAAADGSVDVALTTSPAAALWGLSFATRTRNIRMLWSIFAARPAESARTAAGDA